MDVVRQTPRSIPGARIVLQDISQTGFSPSRGGGFPIEFNVRGPDWNVLGRARRARSWSGCATRAWSPTSTATTGSACPRCRWSPTATGPPTSASAWPTIGETVNAAIGGAARRQVQGQGAALRHPRAPARAAARAPGGHRAAAGAHRRRRARAPRRARPHRAAADAAGDHAPRPRAGDHDLRQRRSRRLAGRRHRPLAGDRPRECCPTATAPSPSGSTQGLPRVVPVAAGSPSGSACCRLHGARVAVQLLHAPVHGPARAALQRQRRALRAVDRRPEPQRLQHARAHPADGHRQEELDHARRLHQPDPRARRRAARGAAPGLPDPAAADPDDLDRDHRRRAAAGPRHRPRAPSCSGRWRSPSSAA